MSVLSIVVTVFAAVIVLFLLAVFLLGSRLDFWRSPMSEEFKQRMSVSLLIAIWVIILAWILYLI